MQKRNRFSTGLRFLKLLAAVVVLGAIVKMVLYRQRPPTAALPPEASGPSNVSRPEPAVLKTEDSSPNGHIDLDQVTKDELYERAKDLDIHGRSKMNKEELAEAIEEHQDA